MLAMTKIYVPVVIARRPQADEAIQEGMHAT
jgi:hypothetical protein